MLQHVVQMDPEYAPAWEELGLRAYYDATYSDGGETMFQLSNQACERAVALDPNLTRGGRAVDHQSGGTGRVGQGL